MSHGMNSDSEDDSTWHEELSLPYSIEEQLNGFKKLQPGTVVQISFDAYHSLKSLRDPTLDCHTTRRRRHLALILSKRGRLVGDIPICTVEYMLVSEGLPRFNPRRGTKDSMCLPILPCTTHPERRAPLEPSPPFPLPNHYVYTSDIYVSRVGNVIGSDSMVPPRFRTEEMKWLQNIQRRDYNHGVLVRVAERHRMMMSKQSPHSTWEDAEHEAAQNPSTCDSPNDTGSLMSAPISLGINWPFEISELREQLSQLPEDQWAIREALALEGVDDTRKLKNPLSIGQCRWRETTIDAWVDQEDWLACSDGHNFARERERLCKWVFFI